MRRRETLRSLGVCGTIGLTGLQTGISPVTAAGDGPPDSLQRKGPDAGPLQVVQISEGPFLSTSSVGCHSPRG